MNCSFCGKSEDEVWRLVAGPGVYICEGCLEVSMQILNVSGGNPGSLRLVSRLPNGTVQRCDLGTGPDTDPMAQPKQRWLRQCTGCGSWNVGTGLTACLECGADLVRRR